MSKRRAPASLVPPTPPVSRRENGGEDQTRTHRTARERAEAAEAELLALKDREIERLSAEAKRCRHRIDELLLEVMRADNRTRAASDAVPRAAEPSTVTRVVTVPSELIPFRADTESTYAEEVNRLRAELAELREWLRHAEPLTTLADGMTRVAGAVGIFAAATPWLGNEIRLVLALVAGVMFFAGVTRSISLRGASRRPAQGYHVSEAPPSEVRR